MSATGGRSGRRSARRSAARIGGLSLHVLRDSRAIAAKAREGLEAKFQRDALAIDPTLTGRALEEKVAAVRRLYYARLTDASVRAREKKAKRQERQRRAGQ